MAVEGCAEGEGVGRIEEAGVRGWARGGQETAGGIFGLCGGGRGIGVGVGVGGLMRVC